MKYLKLVFLLTVAWVVMISASYSAPITIDHNDTDITQLTSNQIVRAKAKLHIGYGHTSHGSQLADGMNGLVGFANGGGKGLSFPTDFFEWNNGGTDGALDLEEGDGYGSGWLDHDCGYWPNWYNETRTYLDDSSHTDVNVIIWSWCGQMDDKQQSGTLSNEYLIPMTSLETSYPDVVFVYMTGHVEIGNDANHKEACRIIRDYCTANNKVFYDFADIEHYDPDGTYFEYVNDYCNYYDAPGGSQLGNWASEWQNSHTENVDWYSCGSAHSLPLNANQKAYAAWALWCAIAEDLDRDDLPDEWEEKYGDSTMFKGGTNDCDHDGATDWEELVADTNPTNNDSFFQINAAYCTNAFSIHFNSSSGRVYSLQCVTNLTDETWENVPHQTNMTGTGSAMNLTDTNDISWSAYRLSVSMP